MSTALILSVHNCLVVKRSGVRQRRAEEEVSEALAFGEKLGLCLTEQVRARTQRRSR